MDRTERLVLVVSGVLMSIFFVALVYAATRLRITVPTCVTDVKPFTRGSVIPKGNNQYEVHIVAKMWAFDPPEIRLPVGAEADIYLSALDVTHGLYVEGTNVNLMAVPGSVNAAHVRFDRAGEFAMICHEYCGAAHHLMAGEFVIGGPQTAPVAEAAPVAGASSSEGEKIFQDNGCPACHSVDGSPSIGPTLKGLLGRETELEDGTTVRADDRYIESAIRTPNAQVVKGYPAAMPEAGLSDRDLHELIEYLKSLS
ncbi:MAG TPA: c-type cytochrome [Candidatus Binatia bacterium]|nr:c-type cytochrome [Candidatus Binatia bacterium]